MSLSFLDTLLVLTSLSLKVQAIPHSRRQAPSGVPSYVIDYAPMVYLDSDDKYLPADIGAQLVNTQPKSNFTAVGSAPNPLTLDNLNDLNNDGGDAVYLTSNVDITTNPEWLFGVAPNDQGVTDGAKSCAVIVNDHGDGTVDAFYMYFYAFDFGGVYVDAFNIGDHVGDWEHTMTRFINGTPHSLWYSQHAYGEAFTYDTVEKFSQGQRPVVYSANGTHANYATTGKHDHAIPNFPLPNGFVLDYTDQGAAWDPVASAYFYSFDAGSQTFAAYDDSTPVNYLYFSGHWGDQQYPKDDPRQSSPFNINTGYKYTNGPTGPLFKQLDRDEVCPKSDNDCIVKNVLLPGARH